MKLILFLLLCGFMFAPTDQYAQTKEINKFYRSYKIFDNNVKMTIPGWLIDAGANVAKWGVDTPQEKESLNLLKKVKKMKLLVSDSYNPSKEKKITKLFTALKQDSFEDLIQIRDKETRVNIMIREDNSRIKNLFIMVREPNEFVMVSMKTNLTMDQVNDLINLMEDDIDVDINL